MKIFGKIPAIVRDNFTLNYLDANEDPQKVEFSVVPRASGGDIAGIMQAMNGDGSESIPRLLKLLRKVMDDKDGLVKSGWSPVKLDPPKLPTPQAPPGEPAPEPEAPEAAYRGPDGEIYPFSDQEKLASWADQSTWTSRRRWRYLLEEDDDAVIEMEDLMEITEWIIGLATDRPTQPRA